MSSNSFDNAPKPPENFEQTPFPFGKYQGKPLSDIPLTYLDWVIGRFTEEGVGNWMGGVHDDFLENLQLYMNQEWVVRELEGEIEKKGSRDDSYEE